MREWQHGELRAGVVVEDHRPRPRPRQSALLFFVADFCVLLVILQGLHLPVRCGDVEYASTGRTEEVPKQEAGDAMVSPLEKAPRLTNNHYHSH